MASNGATNNKDAEIQIQLQPLPVDTNIPAGNVGGDAVVSNSANGDAAGNGQQHSTQTYATSKAKRKQMNKRSDVWKHFTEVKDEKGAIRGKCNYCDKFLACDTKINGTTSLRNHMRSCMKNPTSIEARHKQLSLHSTMISGAADNDNVGNLTCWKFDPELIRESLSKMLIIDELPFRFVEGEGFRKFMDVACSRYKVPSRWTLSRDCYQLYLVEMMKLKTYFKKSSQRINITTDTWTSLQRLNYMCITAHFIDSDWKLHKKILNFCPISCHKGESICREIEECLVGWGINKVFSITVDNASSNDVVVAYLKKKLMNWGTSIANGNYLHMRCIAHITNLVVVEGLKEVNASVKKVRDAVRYIRTSPTRMKRFKECVAMENIDCKKALCLDVSTRWNSTYLMLSTAEQYERAFDRYEYLDPCFKHDLKVEADGVPSCVDWDVVQKLSNMLQFLYHSTLRISSSKYVTYNTLWTEISDLYGNLLEWIQIEDVDLSLMGDRMKGKFDKYLGGPERMNKLIWFAIVVDPRGKFEVMKIAFSHIYGKEKGESLFQNVKASMFNLYQEYKNMHLKTTIQNPNVNESQPTIDVGGGGPNGGEKVPRHFFKGMYKKQRTKVGNADYVRKSELELYLNEELEEDSADIDILMWWKANSVRFPILSQMARDILVVPISTVASESAFSTGGRVLDPYRSSLSPKIVEALICTQDWLKASTTNLLFVEENYNEMEMLEAANFLFYTLFLVLLVIMNILYFLCRTLSNCKYEVIKMVNNKLFLFFFRV
ncbi:Tam3-transposase (Ac family) protein [Dioscorea alata]|uniref:Tam3-transposase (Ac family) protein n=1 Tax=Dioscorea alata TaxID=55571 RepID=A0ACB7URR4_DIOAL|nr:Tam3-transposase (Ac family) protein [Dioscorea alata]